MKDGNFHPGIVLISLFYPCISKAYVNLPQSDTICLHGLTSPAGLKNKYMKSNARTAVKKFGSLCAREFFIARINFILYKSIIHHWIEYFCLVWCLCYVFRNPKKNLKHYLYWPGITASVNLPPRRNLSSMFLFMTICMSLFRI